jgi:hypothetical protein
MTKRNDKERNMNRSIVTALAALTLGVPFVSQAQTVTSGFGSNAAGIQASVDAFRASLGTLNPNVAGSFGSGRREINWDGVPDARSAPANMNADFFNVNSPRGAVFSTPGSGVQVSSRLATGVPIDFGNIDPSYTNTFSVFSPQRLFTAIDSNIVDVNFFVPGSTNPALVRAFGSVFSDVDLANTTSIEFFDVSNTSLGTFFAPASTGTVSEGQSFLGVEYASPIISRVRITNGNAALGVGVLDQNGNPIDLVVMDDFLYSEPVAVVPEPGAMALLCGVSVCGTGILLRRRRAGTVRQ